VVRVDRVDGSNACVGRFRADEPNLLQSGTERHGAIGVLDRRHDTARDHELRGDVGQHGFGEEEFHLVLLVVDFLRNSESRKPFPARILSAYFSIRASRVAACLASEK
jgi:hypothetical protein